MATFNNSVRVPVTVEDFVNYMSPLASETTSHRNVPRFASVAEIRQILVGLIRYCVEVDSIHCHLLFQKDQKKKGNVSSDGLAQGERNWHKVLQLSGIEYDLKNRANSLGTLFLNRPSNRSFLYSRCLPFLIKLVYRATNKGFSNMTVSQMAEEFIENHIASLISSNMVHLEDTEFVLKIKAETFGYTASEFPNAVTTDFEDVPWRNVIMNQQELKDPTDADKDALATATRFCILAKKRKELIQTRTELQAKIEKQKVESDATIMKFQAVEVELASTEAELSHLSEDVEIGTVLGKRKRKDGDNRLASSYAKRLCDLSTNGDKNCEIDSSDDSSDGLSGSHDASDFNDSQSHTELSFDVVDKSESGPSTDVITIEMNNGNRHSDPSQTNTVRDEVTILNEFVDGIIDDLCNPDGSPLLDEVDLESIIY